MTNKDFTTQLLKIFASNPFETLNHKQVSARMGAMDKASRQKVINTILDLADEGVLICESRGKFRINPHKISDDLLPQNFVVGTLDIRRRSQTYVIPDDPEAQEIFVAPNNIGHALHGDTVKIQLFPARKMKQPEGRVVEVVKRAKTQFVGLVEIQRRFAFLIPDLKTMNVDIFIPLENLGGARNGQKALVEMVEWPDNLNNPVGKVLQVLGNPGENDVEMQSILAEFDFPLSFPAEVEKAAEKIPAKITDEEIARRRDFRDDITFTIDPADAKDFDDAISFRRLDNGRYRIGVHIADVSHYVKPGTPIDNEAYSRATSVYLVDRTIPMLPEKLCNNLCSLRPNEDKLCFSAVFEMDDEARVHNQWFGKTVINSNRRFSYEEAQQIIETGEGDLKDEILKLNELAQIMKEARHKTGAINFESVEVKFKLDENAKPIGVYIKEQKEANFLIEEFMLLANKSVAEFVGKPHGKGKAKTFVYRVHDEPNPEKLNTFVQFVRKLGYKMNVANRQSLAKSFNNLFDATEGKGEQNMIDAIAIRTMAKAYYSTENIGHYGLAFPYYTHFTSPIRRYPDLMVHRLLEHYLNGGKSADQTVYEERCKHASLMERKAVEAERTSVKYKQAEFLSDKIGQEFPALISGVSKWGIYAEIEGNKCEGMISLGDLNDDFYYLDEDNYQVIGRRYGKTYKLGSPVTIRVKRVDMQRKQLDFTLVNDDDEPTARPDRRRETKEQRPDRKPKNGGRHDSRHGSAKRKNKKTNKKQ